MGQSLLAWAELLGSALWQKVCGRRASQPRRDQTLVAAGLSREVWICRDEFGVPQIYGETAGDLAFGLGLAVAQDRLWQMDTLRHLAAGRLAEFMGDRPLGGVSLHLTGPTILAVDYLYRSLRMHAVGREERTLLSDGGRAAAEGFAAGVNAWVGQCHPRDLPPEYRFTGVRPEPWTPEDSFAVGKLIGWFLSLAFAAKPVLASLASDAALRSLLPPDLSGGRCIVGDGLPSAPASMDLLARQALGLTGPGVGSNSWVVSGRRTASGKPLLCNDPHLLFGLPALWYPAALHGPEYRVVGVTMPGVPAILIGRNDHLAWGFTAVMADDGDYYRETLDAAGAHYLRDGTWHPVEIVEDVFRIRSRPSVRHALRYVRHGGIQCPLLSQPPGGPPTSFRWVGLEPWRGLEAILGMNRARDVAEFEAALQDFAVPAQNAVVADRHGTIAYFCAGKFPRRARKADSPMVLDGACPRDAWQGYLTWAELPKSINPPAGFVVTANNRIAPELPSTLASGFWEPSYRAARIAELLGPSRNADVGAMARIQADVLSVQAAGILAHVVRPISQTLEDPRARQAAALLLNWDYRMLAESASAALYHLFYQELLQRCFRPAMERNVSGSFARYFSTLHLAVPAADAALLTSNGVWFPGGARVTVEACLLAAWEAAVAKLGPNASLWRWGSLHTLTLSHGFGRGRGVAARVLAWLLELNRGPYARPGDGMTVNLGAFPLTTPFEVAVGPSYRQIVDLGDPEASRWILAGGVSGDPRSPHYADQTDPWLRGEYLPMRLRPMTEAQNGEVLRLVPDAAAAPHESRAGEG
jgi:penicillin amidase